MSWTQIWVHVVFATKYRTPYLKDEIRTLVFRHIKDNADEKGLFLDVVNGYTDHAHCLVRLGREHSISKVVQQIKGESAHWINQNKLTKENFVWQDDFWAMSVSERHVIRVRRYILNQEMHHRKQTFPEEIKRFEEKLILINPKFPKS